MLSLQVASILSLENVYWRIWRNLANVIDEMLAWSYVAILFKRVLINCIIKTFTTSKDIFILMLISNIKRFKEPMDILLLTMWLIRRSGLLLRPILNRCWTRSLPITTALNILHQVVEQNVLTILCLHLFSGSFVVTSVERIGLKVWTVAWAFS